MKRTFVVAVLGALLALSLAACSGSGSDNSASPPPATPTAAPGGAFTLDELPALVAKVEPTVVTVFTNIGQGSGIIWSSDGKIVTNNHVIANATSINVQFADGRMVGGKVLASDANSDTAVLSVERTNLPVATWATATPAVGTFVVAIGDPLGLENSASIGIVSGLNRNLPGADGMPPVADLLQTSAPISPGNSGGALVDDRGHVVGMTEAFLPPSTGAVSIGLAIPAPTVTSAVNQLLKTGEVMHTFIGVGAQTLTPQIADQLHVKASAGVVVKTVEREGPAAAAGLRAGDVIIGLERTAVPTTSEFVLAVREHKPGDVVALHYLRDGASRTAKVTLTSRAS